MSTAAQVRVDLPGRAYRILIGEDELDRLGEHVAARIKSTRATIVTDDIVGPLYLNRAVAGMKRGGFEAHAITVPAGEHSKSWVELSRIHDELAARQHGRDEPIVALGGGVVGDLAGFAAATWNRGVPFVQCPTTLEAQIDASIGGKTAINHAAGKNLIGAFHQPSVVCIDVSCLGTLSDRDFIAGLAESIKHAIICDPAFFAWHEASGKRMLDREPAAIIEMVRRNCEIKARVVEQDERESATDGVGRAALNFGHTIGHAIEAQAAYALRHGEAVALGMIAEMDLAVRRCGLAAADRDRAITLIAGAGLPTRSTAPIDTADVISRLGTDKKTRGQMVRYVVPRHIGQVTWLEGVTEDELRHAIASVSMS